MAEHDNTAFEHATDDLEQSRADAIDHLGRRAGAALRRPAPSDGSARIAHRVAVRRMVRATGVGAVLVAAIVAGIVLSDRGSSEPQRPTDTTPKIVSSVPETRPTLPPPSTENVLHTAAGFVLASGATSDTPVGAMQFSSDGSQLAVAEPGTGCRDCTTGGVISVLSAETLQVEQKLNCPAAVGGFPTLQLQPLGAEFDTEAKQMITAMNSPALAFTPSTTALCTATFSPDGDRVVLFTGPPVAVLDVSDGSELARLDGTNAAFSPDSTRVVTGGPDSVRVWDATTGAQLAELEPLGFGSPRRAVFSPDGDRIVSMEREGLRIWDAHTYAPIVTLADRQAFELAFTADGTRLAVATFDGASMIDISSGEELYHVSGLGGEVFWVALSPDNSLLAIGGIDGPNLIFDAASAEQLAVFPASEDDPFIEFSPDGRTLVVGSQISLQLWTYDRS